MTKRNDGRRGVTKRENLGPLRFILLYYILSGLLRRAHFVLARFALDLNLGGLETPTTPESHCPGSSHFYLQDQCRILFASILELAY